MVKETLVGLDINGGNKVLAMLDDAKFPVPVALWIRQSSEAEWTLLLASPLYERLGLGEATLRMVRTLWPAEINWVQAPIRLESTRQPLVRALRKIFGKARDVEGMRLGGQMIGDTWVEDAYIYRVK